MNSYLKLNCFSARMAGAFLLAAVFVPQVQAEAWTDQLSAEFAEELSLRSLGPALKPGRVSDLAIHPRNRSIWYVTVGSGGLWKTENRGASFEPIFDEGGSYSLGCVTIDSVNPDTIWLGTGENSSNRSVGFGDGIYKSTDAGATWKRMGLEQSEHISVILVNPEDPDTVYVAAEGPLWSSGGERGVYKTTDGGESWKCVLEISEHTGVTGIVFDPRDPEVIYAAAYQRQRHNGLLVGGGPESAIYKTTDGGSQWKKLENGIPSVHKGRISLAVSPQYPDTVYALIAARGEESGFFRSADAGETWVRQSNYKALDPQYYGEIYADPHQFDRIYTTDVWVHLSEDGGKTFAPQRWPIHVDNHVVSIDPTDENHLLVGNDGGLYESYDRGETWHQFMTFPTGQLYRVTVDNQEPFYHVYGGTQDNGSMGGPSRTVDRAGIRSSEWIVTGGGDGFQTLVDPTDSNILYVTTQNGGITRLNTETGKRTDIRPKAPEGGEELRWHWDSPLLMSAYSAPRIYFAGNKLFRSDDRGHSWQAVSEDLTRQLDAHDVPAMGQVWPEDAVQKNNFTSTLSVATALAESSLEEGLLYVGTDDGLLQMTGDGGETWKKQSEFPGVPEGAYVSDLCASQHDSNVVYLSFNEYQNGDYQPYLLKSQDRGASWKSIASNLPERHCVWSVVEDHENPDLLFVGTELGLFFSVNGGGHWTQLRSGVPTISFRDLVIQSRENDLVAATFGRGFYVLDDYSALRELDEASLRQDAVLFSSQGARAYHEVNIRPPIYGNLAFPNPEFGAVLTYHLGKEFAEGASVLLVVEDEAGAVIRRLLVDGSPGLHRVNWNLRPEGQEKKRSRGGSSVPMVKPGDYRVKLVVERNGEVTVLGEPQVITVQEVE